MFPSAATYRRSRTRQSGTTKLSGGEYPTSSCKRRSSLQQVSDGDGIVTDIHSFECRLVANCSKKSDRFSHSFLHCAAEKGPFQSLIASHSSASASASAAAASASKSGGRRHNSSKTAPARLEADDEEDEDNALFKVAPGDQHGSPLVSAFGRYPQTLILSFT